MPSIPVLYYKYITGYFKLRDVYFLKKCVRSNVLLKEVKYSDPKKLLLLQSGIVIEKGINEYLLESVSSINDLCNICGAVFQQDDKKLFVIIKSIKYEIQTSEEIYILREIFLNGSYNYMSPGEYVLLDIGMNVGMTSLYFASKEACKNVIGFEPFLPTYNQALNNFDMNTSLKMKINHYNFGLSDKDETLQIKYNSSLKGSMSTTTGTNEQESKLPIGYSFEHISLKSVQKVFESISISGFKKNGYKIVVKMDCEGAEYNIIAGLKESGHLSEIDSMMIEWHGKDPAEIVTALTTTGFVSWLLDSYHTYGMIYATRQ